MSTDRNLLGKIIISGTLECLTGLHIGASKENIEIGAIDSPVVKDPITREPYIPGSSLKGKMRALLEKALAAENGIIGKTNRRNIGTDRNQVWIHVCDDANKAVNCPICRIYGSTGIGNGKNFPARLIVRDLRLTDESREKLSGIDTGLQYVEWKFENAIDRITSAANPRQLERVPRGAEFKFELIYNVEDTKSMKTDLQNIKLSLDILEADTLGGHGSRGYGHVKFNIKKIEGKTINGFKGKPSEFVEVVSFTEEGLRKIEELFNSKKAEAS